MTPWEEAIERALRSIYEHDVETRIAERVPNFAELLNAGTPREWLATFYLPPLFHTFEAWKTAYLAMP